MRLGVEDASTDEVRRAAAAKRDEHAEQRERRAARPPRAGHRRRRPRGGGPRRGDELLEQARVETLLIAEGVEADRARSRRRSSPAPRSSCSATTPTTSGRSTASRRSSDTEALWPKPLIIVDYQNDFARPDGALSVPDGEAIAPRLNALAASGDYELVVATRDWHPPDHGSFAEQGGIWPVHCVQGTEGAELHPALDTGPLDAIVDKGQARDTEGYSAFDATSLAETPAGARGRRGDGRRARHGLLRQNTALDALREGFTVRVDRAARARRRRRSPATAERALDELAAAGASVA